MEYEIHVDSKVDNTTHALMNSIKNACPLIGLNTLKCSSAN